MAYYDALIAKWATLTPGTTAAKLAQINALTVTTGIPLPCILKPSQILNACVAADLIGLSAANIGLVQLLLTGELVDASNGTTIRSVFQTLFAGKTTTLAQLGALVTPFDSPTIPWWQGTIAQGGGGLSSPVSSSDLAAAGGLT